MAAVFKARSAMIPVEIFFEILSHLADQYPTLCTLASVSRSMQALAEPLIYRSVSLDRVSSFHAYCTCLQTLASCPRRASYVREIRIVNSVHGPAGRRKPHLRLGGPFLRLVHQALHALTNLETYRVVNAVINAPATRYDRHLYPCSVVHSDLEDCFPDFKALDACVPACDPSCDDFCRTHPEITEWFLGDTNRENYNHHETSVLPPHVLPKMNTIDFGQRDAQPLRMFIDRPLERIRAHIDKDSIEWDDLLAPFQQSLHHLSLSVKLEDDSIMLTQWARLSSVDFACLKSITISVPGDALTADFFDALRGFGSLRVLILTLTFGNVDIVALAECCMEASCTLESFALRHDQLFLGYDIDEDEYEDPWFCQGLPHPLVIRPPWICYRRDQDGGVVEFQGHELLNENSWRKL